MNLRKIHWLVTLTLAATVAIMGYFFLIKGSTFMGEDGRTTIVLSEGEKASVLGEMRAMLEGLQTITEAIGNNDMAAVALTASSLGMVVANADSPELIAKLPLEVKTLGLGTHAAFDDLAAHAKETDNPNDILLELSDLMLNCTTCHASYRIAIEDFDE
ncbi:MAG: hypothetical protein V3V13_04155 [Paracoccaceae bacterium]